MAQGDLYTFTFLVDWDSDGDFDDALDDISVYVQQARWSIGMSRPYQLVGDETRLELLLFNGDGRFSPDNSDSPLFGNLLPRRPVKVRVTYQGATTDLYQGYIERIEPAGGEGRACRLSCAGAKAWLQRQLIFVPLLENKRSDEVIDEILKRLEFPVALGGDTWQLGTAGHSELGETTYLVDPTSAYSLESGDSTFEYVADNWDEGFYGNQHVGDDWAEGFYGYEAIADVVKAERGHFFFDQDGVAVFWARSHLLLQTSLQDTYDKLHEQIQYAYGEHIANQVRVKVYPRKLTAAATLWELDETITLKPGQDKTVTARYSDGSEQQVGGDSVSVDSITKDAHISHSVDFFGNKAVITLTNTSSSLEGSVTALVLKGTKLTAFNQLEIEKNDIASKLAYGARELRIDSKMLSDEAFGHSLAEWELSRRKDPMGIATAITWRNTDAGRIEKTVNLSMGRRVRVLDAQLSHDSEYYVMGWAHDWDLRRGWATTIYLEIADANDYWVLGMAGFSELGETTRLGV